MKKSDHSVRLARDVNASRVQIARFRACVVPPTERVFIFVAGVVDERVRRVARRLPPGANFHVAVEKEFGDCVAKAVQR